MCYNAVCLEIGSMCLGGDLEGSPGITSLSPGSDDGYTQQQYLACGTELHFTLSRNAHGQHLY